jgi:hypothetical protein
MPFNREKEKQECRERDEFGKRTSSEEFTTRSMVSLTLSEWSNYAPMASFEALTSRSVVTLTSSEWDATSAECVFVLRNDGQLSSPHGDNPLEELTTTDCQQSPLQPHDVSSTQQGHESSNPQNHESAIQQDHESALQ